VHYSSGVANHFYFLLADGTTNGSPSPTCVAGNTKKATGTGSVTGIGRTKAEKIWYRALTVHMTAGTNYAAARSATTSAAADLYGAGSPEANAVASAWTAVSRLEALPREIPLEAPCGAPLSLPGGHQAAVGVVRDAVQCPARAPRLAQSRPEQANSPSIMKGCLQGPRTLASFATVTAVRRVFVFRDSGSWSPAYRSICNRPDFATS
jgi:hypothetical protein